MAGEVLQPGGLHQAEASIINLKVFVIWFTAFSAVFLAVTLPVSTYFRANEKNFDEQRCYLPAIEQLREKFPQVDLATDSLSANPPGYTQLLAGLSLISNDSISWLRFWHNLISLLGAGGLLWIFLRSGGEASVLLILPTILSTYYIKQSCVISTDNVALTAVGIGMAILALKGPSLFWNLIAGILSIWAIYTRQISVWVILPLGIAMFLESRKEGQRRIVIVLGLTILGCLALLSSFYSAWDGLVPMRFKEVQAVPSLSGIVYGLSLVALLAPFFFDRNVLFPTKQQKRKAFFPCLAGILVFLAAPSSWSYEEGRWGGILWLLAKKGPLFFDRSIIFLPLTSLGALFTYQIFLKVKEKDLGKAMIWGGGVVGWLATSIPNGQVFHRYFESPILLFLGIAASMVSQTTRLLKFKITILCGLFLITGIFVLYFTDNAFPSGPILKIGTK